jgi:hypothetical protein
MHFFLAKTTRIHYTKNVPDVDISVVLVEILAYIRQHAFVNYYLPFVKRGHCKISYISQQPT